MELEKNSLVILKHPIIEHNLSILRDKNTNPELFRSALRRITYFLFAEATKNLPTKKIETETPLKTTATEIIAPEKEIVIAPILRAGLIFSDIAMDFLPQASLQHIGMYRDEVTLQPVWYFDKSYTKYREPKDIFVYILDPMLATGNSAKATIELFLGKDIPAENITFMSLISAPEGVCQIADEHPKIKIITAALDERLNDVGYILPGLGDAGDRIFNTLGY